ncbi:MAG: carbamoyltransferase HypF [Aliifodinibius sp.]|nr:carbamoyltransferase HypF [candidate division Zixibacteria bacterium]NIT56638.1 carbamoyltransferase HypF [Fodinibius sp.]NIY25221.1 carbamoyltransferase HypF [Fodinibius sp.]
MNKTETQIQVAQKTFHIHFQGKVQGVGFRPFVYRLATAYHLNGWVSNGMDGVHIELSGDRDTVYAFFEDLLQNAPAIASITGSNIREISDRAYAGFQVYHSNAEGQADLLILPDLDICDECLEDLQNPTDRRYGYAFITCTNCGPRYSIIEKLPYDRENTTMEKFPMCPSCQAEYDDPLDRRFYSQTNSCPACGIQLNLVNEQQQTIASNEQAIDMTVDAIRAGKIVAVKGIGGYLLVVDAFNEKAVAKLRQQKHRPTKPFALMYPDLNSVFEDAFVSEAEEQMLLGRQKPIVILQKRDDVSRIAKSVAPLENTLGIMLPYAPLHYLLLEKLQQPVLATSGNISGSPILSTEEQAFNLLDNVADLWLINNREIVVSQDDSVIRFAPGSGQQIILRRSRSYAPIYSPDKVQFRTNPSILALGAEKKSSITLTHSGNIYVSQYLGDLKNYETELNYKSLIKHFSHLLSFRPQQIVADLHPQYISTRYGLELAEKHGLVLQQVQHHKAHFWALLGEHQQLFSEQPILGVIWDGAGWGDDETIWGSEFFVYDQGEMERITNLQYFPLLMGDKSALEPRLSALSLWREIESAENLVKPKFSEIEWEIYFQYLQRQKYYRTSSMGRLFDAVASLLGVTDKISFEGEAAMRLETCAWQYVLKMGSLSKMADHPYYTERYDLLSRQIDCGPLLNEMLLDLQQGVEQEQIAFKFHLSLVNLIRLIAEEKQVSKIGFSGGVFQNALLVDLIQSLLSKEFHLLFHIELSPNDENISFGQMIYSAWKGNELS